MIRERVGVVQDKIYELANIAMHPDRSFVLSTSDYVHLEDPNTIATWHTHPNSDNTPSEEDLEAFLAWPHLTHYILGTNGLAFYGKIDDHCHITWLPEGLILGNDPVPGVYPLGSLASIDDAGPVLPSSPGT